MKAKSTKKVVAKSTSKNGNGKAEKVITYRNTKRRWKSGVRAECQAAIPAAGATAEVIAKRSKAPLHKTLAYLSWMNWKGYVTKHVNA